MCSLNVFAFVFFTVFFFAIVLLLIGLEFSKITSQIITYTSKLLSNIIQIVIFSNSLSLETKCIWLQTLVTPSTSCSSWHLWNATDGFFSRSDGCRQNMWAIATNFRHEQWENWGNRRFLWFNALHQSRCNWNIIQLLLDGSDCWLNCFLPRSDERAGEETLPSDEEWVWF